MGLAVWARILDWKLDTSVIYKSKVDAWVAVLLVVAGLGMLAAGIAAAVSLGSVTAVAPIGIVALVILALMWPLYYEITDAELTIRAGVVRWHIPLSNIVRVRPSSSAVSSPALSLDRLEIAYEKNGALKRVLISPADAENFLCDLRARAPQLHPSAGGLAKEGSYVPL